LSVSHERVAEPRERERSSDRTRRGRSRLPRAGIGRLSVMCVPRLGRIRGSSASSWSSCGLSSSAHTPVALRTVRGAHVKELAALDVANVHPARSAVLLEQRGDVQAGSRTPRRSAPPPRAPSARASRRPSGSRRTGIPSWVPAGERGKQLDDLLAADHAGGGRGSRTPPRRRSEPGRRPPARTLPQRPGSGHGASGASADARVHRHHVVQVEPTPTSGQGARRRRPRHERERRGRGAVRARPSACARAAPRARARGRSSAGSAARRGPACSTGSTCPTRSPPSRAARRCTRALQRRARRLRP